MGKQKEFVFTFPDGRDPQLKRRVLPTVLFLLFLLAALSYSQDIGRPETCAMCHVMVPHVRTWEASNHKQASCLTCHQQPGIIGFFRFQASMAQMAYRYLTESYYLPVTVKEKIPADVCFSCHALNRKFTASGDLIVPHQTHQTVSVNCMDCHKGVVHSNISSRQLALSTDVQQWTRTFAKKQMQYQFRNLSMKECMDCHTSRRADTSCKVCHKDIDYPPSHYEAGFMRTHGLQAFDNIDACDKCHSWTRSKTETPGTTVNAEHPIRDYARGNTFCVDCHLKRPEGHHQFYRGLHGYDAKARGTQGCQVCHDMQQPVRDIRLPRQTATTTNCISCHVRKHKGPWQLTHPVPVWGRKYDRSCIGCHSTMACGKCHQITD